MGDDENEDEDADALGPNVVLELKLKLKLDEDNGSPNVVLVSRYRREDDDAHLLSPPRYSQ